MDTTPDKNKDYTEEAEELKERVPHLQWLGSAKCANIDSKEFFVSAGIKISDDVKKVCQSCPVRKECIAYAYALNIKYGFWGGLSVGKRDSMTLEAALEHIDKENAKE